MRTIKKLVSLLAAFCMVLTMNLTVFATSDATSGVADARKGVIQVRLYYVDDAGQSHWLQSGSGFLIGAGSGATTVITNHHVVTLPDHSSDPDTLDKEKASLRFGVNFFNSNEVNMQVRVVVKRDVEINASYVNGSEQTDFAILELEQAIFDRNPLKLANSDELVETKPVYALGFPAVASRVEDDSVFTIEDVTITNGIIAKFQNINNIGFVLHNAQLGYGNSGGPLVDANGNVVGVNTLFYGDDAGTYYSSVAINEIRGILDALGVTYENADGAPTPEPVVDPQPVVEEVVEEVEPETVVTTEPVVDLGPEPVIEEPAPGPNMGLIIGIGAAVVVILIIVVVVVSNSKKKNTKAPAAVPVSATPVAPVPPAMPNMPNRPTPPSFSGMPADSGAGETSVLGAGAGETSVLGGATSMLTATLIRKKNGETARISKPMFTIGKERQKVDFCIPDNTSISRVHVKILGKNGAFFIVDNNSTNYTYVNGNKVAANQEFKLNSGDKIKLADEEFEIRF